MLKTVSLLVAVLTLFITAAACVQEARSVPQSGVEPGGAKPAAGATARADWQVEWEKVLAQGKSEGKVVVITSVGPTQRDAVAKGVKSAHALDVEYVVAAGTALLARTKAERGAGLYTSDILLGGPTTQLTYRDAGFLDPFSTALILPDIKDPNTWFGGVMPYMEKGGYVFSFQRLTNSDLIINTEMVRPGEVTSYKDLLDPKWKGKIILQDPTISGRGNNMINSVIWELMGEDYVRALAKQELVVTRDIRLQAESVARGKYAIGLAATDDVVVELKNAGAPIEQLHLKEGGSIGASQGSVSMLSRQAHPNAARVFINWLLGKEGQLVIGKALGNASRRVDVPTDYVDPDKVPKQGVRYIDTDTEEQIRLRADRAVLDKEIFGIR
ncbi:MAG: extracellular solute-binding protein [Chloroflexi bacterium]|nr:extracellular solute-binding protein [Chloroflexota bacterium]